MNHLSPMGIFRIQSTSNYSLTDILNRVDEKMYEAETFLPYT